MKNIVKKELDGATRASVTKEMAKPRMTKSAREGEMNLVAARIAHGKFTKKKPQPLPLAVPRVAL